MNKNHNKLFKDRWRIIKEYSFRNKILPKQLFNNELKYHYVPTLLNNIFLPKFTTAFTIGYHNGITNWIKNKEKNYNKELLYNSNILGTYINGNNIKNEKELLNVFKELSELGIVGANNIPLIEETLNIKAIMTLIKRKEMYFFISYVSRIYIMQTQRKNTIDIYDFIKNYKTIYNKILNDAK